MKFSLCLFLLSPVFIVCAANISANDLEKRNPGHINPRDFPECLHIGRPSKAFVTVDAGAYGMLFDLVLISQSGKISASFTRTGGIGAPIAVTFHGEKFGTDIVTIFAPGQPDILPLTATIRVLPSFDPPQELSTHPTDKMSHPVPDAEDYLLFHEIIYRWRSKEGVMDYGVDTYDAEIQITEGSIFSGRGNRGKAWVTPGERYYWRVQAKIETCDSREAWTRFSPYIPFDG